MITSRFAQTSTTASTLLGATLGAVLCIGLLAPAQAQAQGIDLERASGAESRAQAFHGNESVLGGPGYFTTAVGAGFSGGLATDNTMLNLTAGYNIDYTAEVTGKAFADLNLGMGSDSARFIDVALGANYFPMQIQMNQIKPYLGADAGVGFVRNNASKAADSLVLGAGAGFQLLTQQTNIDVSLRYEFLTEQINGNNPEVLGLKVGMNY